MKLKDEYLEFMSGDLEPNVDLDSSFKRALEEDLKYFKPFAFGKFFLSQSVGALLTLTVCPQFGIGPIGGGHGIAHYFMAYGEWACASFCGVLFLGLSSLLSTVLLSKGEKRLIKKSYFAVSLIISSFWLASLMGISKILTTKPMFNSAEFNSIWFLSGLVSMFLVFKIFYGRSLKILRY